MTSGPPPGFDIRAPGAIVAGDVPGARGLWGREMSDEVPKAEEKLGLFFSPTIQGGGGFLIPMGGLNTGPGEPGPGDEWRVPAPDEAEPSAQGLPEPEPPAGQA